MFSDGWAVGLNKATEQTGHFPADILDLAGGSTEHPPAVTVPARSTSVAMATQVWATKMMTKPFATGSSVTRPQPAGLTGSSVAPVSAEAIVLDKPISVEMSQPEQPVSVPSMVEPVVAVSGEVSGSVAEVQQGVSQGSAISLPTSSAQGISEASKASSSPSEAVPAEVPALAPYHLQSMMMSKANVQAAMPELAAAIAAQRAQQSTGSQNLLVSQNFRSASGSFKAAQSSGSGSALAATPVSGSDVTAVNNNNNNNANLTPPALPISSGSSGTANQASSFNPPQLKSSGTSGSDLSPLSPQTPNVPSKLLINESDIVIDRSRKLGEGGFGIVYVGTLRGTMQVAVKTIRGELDQKTMQNFVKEVQNWEGLVQRNGKSFESEEKLFWFALNGAV